MPGDRHLLDRGAQLLELGGALLDQLVDHLLRLRMAEAFLDHADLEACGAAAQRLGVGVDRAAHLPRVEPVGTGDDLQHQGVVGHRGRHRAGVIERELDRHDAGVGHQAPGRLHADDAAIGRRHADRAALVAADRHVGLAGDDDGGAARGGAAGRIAVLARIVDRTGRGGVAAAGEAEILAMHLADDGGAGIEHAGHHGGVDVGHVAFERAGAVHHRHAGEADIVLQRHLLALELAARARP